MTKEEIQKVEDLVNKEIQADLPVVTEEMSLEDAKKSGAMALFGEKYGDVVRVVKMGDFSTELCGGTHVSHTGEIGSFRIISETGISAGVRRIEALVAEGLNEHYRQEENELLEAAALLKAAPADLSKKITALQEELKKTKAENEALKAKAAGDSVGNAAEKAEEINGVKVLAVEAEAADVNALRTLSDMLKDKLGESAVVLAAATDGKVMLLSAATDGAVKKGVMAGNVIKAIAPLVGGKGGGRPNMAQAGGTDASGIQAALAKAVETLKEQLSK